MELEILKTLGSVGSPALGPALILFVWQIRSSLKHLEKSIAAMQISLTNLNSTLTVLVTEQNNDKKEIDRIRNDILALWSKVNGKS